uniref:Uncharacterized protein n=1 Tax=Helianthus annuus TaxID=4232 RepID=A0A251THY9_HELAN
MCLFIELTQGNKATISFIGTQQKMQGLWEHSLPSGPFVCRWQLCLEKESLS